MNPIIFQEMGSSEGASDGGWKTTYMQDTSEGIHKNDLIPEKNEVIKLKPRVVTKPKNKMGDVRNLVNQTPGNIGRPESQMTRFTVRDRPERVPVLFQPSSPSTKEFMYAPNDLVGATVSNPLPLPIDFPPEDKTNYGDNDLNLELGQDGYRNTEQDSNFSRKPKTWRFRTHDNDLSLRRRGENLPDLQDVGIKEMVYPLQGGLNPVIFGATPRQREQAKRLNRRRKTKPKTEEAVVEELAKKAEAKVEAPKEQPKPQAEEKPKKVVEDPAGKFKFEVEEEEKTLSTVVTVKNAEGKEVVKYGLSNGKPVMTPTYDESVDGQEWIAAMASIFKNLGSLFPEYVPTEYLPEPPEEVTDKLGSIKRPKEADTSYSYKGNVLTDPALEGLDMLPQEKLFTTIMKWEGDSYVMTADKLDAGTKEVLAEKPSGEGKYFSWQYTSPEESEKATEAEIKEKGFTTSPGEGVLSVRRLGGWKQAEAEVQKKRRVRPA